MRLSLETYLILRYVTLVTQPYSITAHIKDCILFNRLFNRSTLFSNLTLSYLLTILRRDLLERGAPGGSPGAPRARTIKIPALGPLLHACPPHYLPYLPDFPTL